MDEPTTRDEHVARARSMVIAASENYVEARSEKDRQSARDMIQAALVHATIAVALGQQPAEAAPLWVPEHKGCFRRAGAWSLIHFETTAPGYGQVGWYLFGPSVDQHGRWVGHTLANAQELANVVVLRHIEDISEATQ